MKGFRPGVRTTLFVMLFLPVFVALGFWQLDRAEQKRAIEREFGAKKDLAPVTLEQALVQPDPNYTRVALRGQLLSHQPVLLDNRLRDGTPGIEVLVPLVAGAQTVLVNLGFLAKATDMSVPPLPVLPSGNLNVTGYLYRPDKDRFVLGESIDTGFPLLLQRMDWGRVSGGLGRELLPWQLRVGPEQPGSFDTAWTIAVGSPSKHQGYAFQWFAMAFALLALYGYSGFKRR
ncbi:SURF1 family protein [Litorivicinus lipolyticus]|uniref:SURF1-like protein n=1 Tax=Litorivicinus lipolyticus TaxID=418701 RepID=A0A5Q2QB34_9GAMM|nr:SURF1 family protein [Litorivicinus lipolyticus]QGG79177.1 SURF1 family protein [Litorivicinus lipolyticus]